MHLSRLAFRPLRGARLRVALSPHLSPSFRFGHITRCLHDGRHENDGNDDQDEDDDDDEDSAMQEDEVLEFQKKYFPVRLGQVFEGRYQTVRKMHWNRYWTFWFCLDRKTNRYVNLKVSTAMASSSDDHPVTRELRAHRHIGTVNSSHPGRTFIHPLLDTFEISRSDGRLHRCLVYPPVVTYARGYENDVKSVVHSVLQVLDFLHTEANMTHCDFSSFDVNRGVEDHRLYDAVVDEEMEYPDEAMIIKGHPVHSTNAINVTTASYSLPTLRGFEESRIGSTHDRTPELIQQAPYRAPELVLQTRKWSHSVDIWNLGCLTFARIPSDGALIWPYDEEGDYSTYLHLAQMISLLGPPPRRLLDQSAISSLLFDAAGNLKSPAELDFDGLDDILHPTKEKRLRYLLSRVKVAGLTSMREAYPAKPLPARSLENLVCVRDQGQYGDEFLDFMRRTLAWHPEERATAAELLQHPWLQEFRPIGVFRRIYSTLPTYEGS